MYNYFFNLLGRFSIGGNILAHIFLLLLLIVCITEIMFSNWENTVHKVGVLKISILIIGIDSAIQAIAEILEYFNISQSGSEDTFWLDLFLLGLSLVFCFIGFKKFRFVILGFIFVFLSGYLAYWIFRATPQNTQKERPCEKIPPGRAYIRHSISAAATLI